MSVQNNLYKIVDHRKGGTSSAKTMKVIAIGGGKGGVGKSFVSTNLAVTFAKMGLKTLLIDLDLGGANLHTYLGMNPPSNGVSDFFKGRASLKDVCTHSGIHCLDMVSGCNDSLDVANASENEVSHLINDLKTLSYDVVVLDLGAGTSQNTLDFFLAADESIVATTPDPTSIENTYRFLKAAFYRRLKKIPDEHGIHEIIDAAMDQKNHYGIRSPHDLLKHVSSTSKLAEQVLEAEMGRLHLSLVLNQVRTQADVDIGHSMSSVCLKYFGIPLQYLGHLANDYAAHQALRKKRPLVLEFPQSNLTYEFVKISKHLVASVIKKAVV